MLVSRYWLQKFFDQELPDAQALADALTFHAFEIESIEKVSQGDALRDSVLDVKVTPNRGHDCLSHRGIAKELAAILDMPLPHDPLAEISGGEASIYRGLASRDSITNQVQVSIENENLCKRYIAGCIKNIKVGPSPKWLKERLESIGQKSINNIVDATNFVMFITGQPLHAFDAGRLGVRSTENGVREPYRICVRNSKPNEKITTLDNKEYELTDSMLLIVDGNSDASIGIAGVKGGLPAAITTETKDIIIESANFNGVSIRKTAQALKLRTDASTRFEQVISPELAAYGMQNVVELILKIAGGELVGYVDEYPNPQQPKEVSVTLEKINSLLGIELSEQEVESVFTRLGFHFKGHGVSLKVEVPFERLDLEIAEDLVEEVGRIIGYDRIEPKPLPEINKKSNINENFFAAEQVREDLMDKGYSEVYTSVFAEKGEQIVANKIDGVRPYLRSNLIDGLKEAYEKNKRNAEFLGLKEVKLFEIGTIWKNGEELMMVGTADKSGVREESLKALDNIPNKYDILPLSEIERYEPFSRYPFIVRDISFLVPENLLSIQGLPWAIDEYIEKIVVDAEVHGTNRTSYFVGRPLRLDKYVNKEGRTSLTYRLRLQSSERTLTEEEVNPIMEKIYSTLKEKGFEIR